VIVEPTLRAFDNEGNFGINAVINDPVILDDGLKLFDVNGLDVANGLGRFGERLLGRLQHA
jgi:hypothetical protein